VKLEQPQTLLQAPIQGLAHTLDHCNTNAWMFFQKLNLQNN